MRHFTQDDWMKVILGAALGVIILVALLVLAKSAQAECLPSARSVWAQHQGSWATWRNVEGRKCWMIGERNGRGGDSRTWRDRGKNNGRIRRVDVSLVRASLIPLPRSRPVTSQDIADLWIQFVLTGPEEAWQ